MTVRDISFIGLDQIPPEKITAHMADPRMAEHMPLLTNGWDDAKTHEFLAAKLSCWERDGLGHWAVLLDGNYAGWGGFQKEGDEWDFGLVLRPEYFGAGPGIAAKAHQFALSDPRIDYVTFLLPLSRKHLGALARIGAVEAGVIEYGGAVFRKFRLDTPGPQNNTVT